MSSNNVSKRKFDVVIVDPPSFTPRQASVERALTQYALLTTKAVKLVRPGGVLVQASCSSRVGADEFHSTVSHAAAQAGRPLEDRAVIFVWLFSDAGFPATTFS